MYSGSTGPDVMLILVPARDGERGSNEGLGALGAWQLLTHHAQGTGKWEEE